MILYKKVIFLLIVAISLSGWSTLPNDQGRLVNNDGFVIDIPTLNSKQGVISTIDNLKTISEKNSIKMNMIQNLEYGYLLRMNKQYAESNKFLLEADREVKNWEQKTTLSLERFASNILAAIFSEKAKSYEGQDYEKVWLTTNLALNKIALGDLEV